MGEADPSRAEQFAQIRPSSVGGLHMAPAARERAYGTLSLMGWATALLLMIACANVANLLLFENLARRGALATLRALGASTGRIARQHLVRSLLVAVLGASGGAALGWGIGALFRGRLVVGLPDFAGLDPDPNLMLLIVGALVATTILFGVVPALFAGRFDLGDALRASRMRETGRLASLRVALSGGQIALTLGLLIGGLLMFRTIANLRGIDTGVDIERVVGVTFDVPRDMEPEDLHALQRTVLDVVASEPGVERAALDWYGPHGSQFVAQVGVPADAENVAALPRTLVWQVSPGWFELFGLGAISGRTFEDADWRIPSSGAAVLTESMARRIFGRSDVVGQPIWVRGAMPAERHVVGVVGNYTSFTVTARQLDEARRPATPTDAVFLPHGDVSLRQITVFAKTAPSTPDVPNRVQAAIESILPEAPSPEPYRLEDRVDQIHREERLLSLLLLTSAGFGAVMSGVGLFAAIYFMVASRKRELGIRVALGADAIRILKLVTRSAAAIVLGGVTAGLVVAYPLSSALRNRVYGIEHLDPISYGTAALALGLVALLACLAPAREALRADPVAVLREE
jgi:predicted permease